MQKKPQKLLYKLHENVSINILYTQFPNLLGILSVAAIEYSDCTPIERFDLFPQRICDLAVKVIRAMQQSSLSFPGVDVLSEKPDLINQQVSQALALI